MSPAKKKAARKSAAKSSSRGATKPKPRSATKSSAKKKAKPGKAKAAKKSARKPSPTRKASGAAKTRAGKTARPAAKKAAVGKKAAAAKKTEGKKAASSKAASSKAAPKKAAAKKAVGKKAAATSKATKATPAKQSAGKKPDKVVEPSYLRATALPVSVHPRFGKKFDCFDCEAKFYDLNKPDPVCPKCGADQRNKPLDGPSASAPKKAKARGRRSRASRPMAPLLDDDEAVDSREDEGAPRRPKVKAGEDYFDNAETISEEEVDEIE
jgi:hypothetical protein